MKRFFLIYFGAVWIAVAALFGFLGKIMLDREAKFHESGVVVDGTVSSKRMEERWERRDGRNEKITSHLVKYTFETRQGRKLEAENGVPESEYQHMHVGEPVPIEYLPDEPEVSRVAGGSETLPGWLMIIFGVLCALVGVGSVVAHFKGMR